MNKWLCKFYHKWILTKDSGVYWYFKCARCGKTKYQKYSGGYQPVDYSLLNNRIVTIEELYEKMERLLDALNKETKIWEREK